MKQNMKLIARYIIILFVMYLAYSVTAVEYINAIEYGKNGAVQVVVGAVFATLTLIINFHFSQKIDKD